MQSRQDKEKEMISPESATIVEERDIWPLIGAVQQKERNVQNVGGMVILLCVVRERVIIMQLVANRISDGGVVIGVSLTMLTLWAIGTHLRVRRIVLLHLQPVTENQGETCNATRLKESVLEVNINGITTRVLIDSGSVSNLIGMEEYEELKAQGLNTKMEDCHKRLYAYGGKELEVIGQVQDEISAGDKKIGSHLVVAKSGRCLLGLETSKALDLLWIGPECQQ